MLWDTPIILFSHLVPPKLLDSANFYLMLKGIFKIGRVTPPPPFPLQLPDSLTILYPICMVFNCTCHQHIPLYRGYTITIIHHQTCWSNMGWDATIKVPDQYNWMFRYWPDLILHFVFFNMVNGLNEEVNETCRVWVHVSIVNSVECPPRGLLCDSILHPLCQYTGDSKPKINSDNTVQLDHDLLSSPRHSKLHQTFVFRFVSSRNRGSHPYNCQTGSIWKILQSLI